MKTFVWEVLIVGGDPAEIRTCIEHALTDLRDGRVLAGLSQEEIEPWVEDISAHKISDLAHDDGQTSVLIDITTYSSLGDDWHTAAVLTGGFDEVVSARLIELPGVTVVTNTDRIERPE